MRFCLSLSLVTMMTGKLIGSYAHFLALETASTGWSSRDEGSLVVLKVCYSFCLENAFQSTEKQIVAHK